MKFLSKIRSQFKQGVRPVNIIRPFVFANLGLFVVVAIIWLYPTIASWNNAREIIARQRQVYAAYREQAGQYQVLQTIYPTHHILQYEEFAAAMAEVQDLARRHGLETTLFTASAPTSHAAGGGGIFVEIRVTMELTGYESKAVEFTYGLHESAAFIRNLHMEIVGDGAVELRIEFSLFGRGE